MTGCEQERRVIDTGVPYLFTMLCLFALSATRSSVSCGGKLIDLRNDIHSFPTRPGFNILL